MTTTLERTGSPGDSRLQRLLTGLTAVRNGDFSTRLPAADDPLMDEIAAVFNGMNEQLALVTSEVTRVAREVGTDGRLGGQAEVPGLAGTWRDLSCGRRRSPWRSPRRKPGISRAWSRARC